MKTLFFIAYIVLGTASYMVFANLIGLTSMISYILLSFIWWAGLQHLKTNIEDRIFKDKP